MQVQYQNTTQGAWTLMVGAKNLPQVSATCDVCMS
jgi:hypothetical protein